MWYFISDYKYTCAMYCILFVAIMFIAFDPIAFSYHNIRNNHELKNEAQLTLRFLDFGLNTVWIFLFTFSKEFFEKMKR